MRWMQYFCDVTLMDTKNNTYPLRLLLLPCLTDRHISARDSNAKCSSRKLALFAIFLFLWQFVWWVQENTVAPCLDRSGPVGVEVRVSERCIDPHGQLLNDIRAFGLSVKDVNNCEIDSLQKHSGLWRQALRPSRGGVWQRRSYCLSSQLHSQLLPR